MNKFIFIIILLLVLSHSSLCLDVGKVVKINGKNLYMKKTAEGKGYLLENKMPVKLDYYIQTGEETTAEIKLDHEDMNTTIRIRSNSLIKIVNRIKKKKKKGVFLVFGRLWSLFKGKKRSYAVETNDAVAGVEGTEFEVCYIKKNSLTILKVNSGKVKLSGKKSVAGFPQIKITKADQIGVVEKGKNIKLFKDKKSYDYKFYNDLLENIVNINTRSKKVGSNNDLITPAIDILSPDEKNELIGTDDGINLRLKFESKNYGFETNETAMGCRALIWIDGANYYKGKQLRYTNGKPLIIPDLQRSEHDITILCLGYQYDTSIDLSDNQENNCIETLKYQYVRIGFKSKKTGKVIIDRDIIKHLKVFVNGQLLKFSLKDYYEVDPDKTTVGRRTNRINIFLPQEENSFRLFITSDKYKNKIVTFDLDQIKKWWDEELEEKDTPDLK